jgi:hypothetical protein
MTGDTTTERQLLPDKEALEGFTSEQEKAAVSRWQSCIISAKSHWAADFDRMRDNMDFVGGFQWRGQTQMDTDEYVANLTVRATNQKVASLYARNPKAVYRSRKRMLYRLWDGRLETLALAIQNAALNDMEALAIIEDYKQGTAQQEILDRVGQTLELLYDWNIDRQEPEFKLQMKQLVRRTVVCGVGYVRMHFQRDLEEPLTSSQTEATSAQLQRRAVELSDRLSRGDVQASDAEANDLQMLMSALQVNPTVTEERLVFDFPSVSSVIVDPACRILKGFVGASWVAQEFLVPLEEANAFFGVQMSGMDGVVVYDEGGRPSETIANARVVRLGDKVFMSGEGATRRVRIWEVLDKRTQSSFFIAEGWPAFLRPPEPLYPSLSRFWPIFALTFNDIETEPGAKTSIYPPSDVQLLKHAQKEWNRTRNELRAHRKANRPKYLTGKGWLTEGDRAILKDLPSSSVVELEGVPTDGDVNKLLTPFQHAPLDPMLYDNAPLQQDVLLTVGLQEANLGPLSGSTATESTIAEQSRMSATGSNVDDLDDFLSDMAKAGGEWLLHEATPEQVQTVVGPGAVWPSVDREAFARELYLEVEAASSGRPNKAVEVANYERLVPHLLAAGANPIALIKEGVRRLDDRLRVEDFFPVPGLAAPMPMQEQQAGAEQPLQTAESQGEGGTPLSALAGA